MFTKVNCLWEGIASPLSLYPKGGLMTEGKGEGPRIHSKDPSS